MHSTIEITKKTQHHDYADSLASGDLAITIVNNLNAKKINSDALEVNLANHIEAFCDCI